MVAFAVTSMTVMAGSAFAACTNPAGDAGHVIFNTTVKTMQYCNGSNWINAGAVIPNAPQTGCTMPEGVPGEVIYASPTGVIQFCNGSSWVNTACAAKRKPNGPGCGGDLAGTLRYNSTHNELQFCDSTDWVAMGWACPNDLNDPVWNSPTTYSYTAMMGQPFGFVPNVSDDGPTITFSLQGTLPTGATFNAATGGVSGIPSALGTYTFTIRATDASANIVERTFTVDVVPAEVVVHIAANTTNVNLQSLFSGADWADTVKTKRVIVNTGVTVGSTSAGTAAMLTGTGRGKDLIIENNGTIAGAGGTGNGGAGGNALLVQQTGVTVVNSGNLYGGGGGGGKGGTGGGGYYGASEGPVANGSYFYEQWLGVGASWRVVWAGVHKAGGATWNGPTSVVGNDGATYYKGGHYSGALYYVSRSATAYTSGGTGGNGGRGQGSDGAATAGLTGAAGGTNAGAGGTGGAGGGWGTAGTAGATGAAGNNGAGLAGNAGGTAGAAITGTAYTLTNTGSILGSH